MKRAMVLVVLLLSATSVFGGNRPVRRMPEPVAGQYLVMLEETVLPAQVPDVARRLIAAHNGKLRRVFQYAVTGFTAELTEVEAEKLARRPDIMSVEEVALGHLSGADPTGTNELYWPYPAANKWQLDIIDGTIDNYYDYCDTGSNVIAYVIGTGVYRDHVQFSGAGGSRVLRGTRTTNDDRKFSGESEDYGYLPCTGAFHETAAASALGGNTLGVAKDVNIVPIRVVNCNEVMTTENVTAAFDWILSPSNPHRSASNTNPALVTMSVYVRVTNCAGDATDAAYAASATIMETAITQVLGYKPSTCATPYAIDKWSEHGIVWNGIPVIASANNFGGDDRKTSPARMAYANIYNNPNNLQGTTSCEARVISVGAMTESKERWAPSNEWVSNVCNQTVPAGSNYGHMVDIYAPGVNLFLASFQDTGSQNDMLTAGRTGTSWAAPIVAGVLARAMSASGRMSPLAAWAHLQASATETLTENPPAPTTKPIVRRTVARNQCP